MKKAKLIVVSAALLLTTIGVFAGKQKFANNDVYANVGGTRIKLVTTSTFNDLTTTQPTGAAQAKVIGSFASTQYGLETFDGTNFIPLYAQSF
jgi:hypothetical protein